MINDKNKSILLIDDDPLFIDILKDMLQIDFNNVKSAINVDEAMKMYHKEKFNLVITDIDMPDINGIALCKMLREINPNQHIIVSSAYSSEKYLLELINIGIDGFLKKPFKINDLKNIIQSALEEDKKIEETPCNV